MRLRVHTSVTHSVSWGWFSEPTTSSSMYKPSTNKDQKNTKAWVQCGPSLYLFIYLFSRMSASAFQRLDSCSAVKHAHGERKRENKKQHPFGKLIRLCKLFRSVKTCLLKVQYLTQGLLCLLLLSFSPWRLESEETNLRAVWQLSRLEPHVLADDLTVGHDEEDGASLLPVCCGLITVLHFLCRKIS